jgi:hypothetical protein
MMGGLPEACSIFEIENKRAVREAESLRLPGRVLVRRRDKFFVGQYEQFRYVPEQLISSSTMMLWGSKTAVFVWSEPYFVILIDNAEVTKGNLATFNYLWSMAEKPTAADVKRHLLKTL